jgi:hypothetical protein
MGREPPTLTLLWGLAVLTAVVALAMAGAPIPVVLALIPWLPHRFSMQPASRRYGDQGDGRDG